MTVHGPTPVAEASDQEARLERLRERIARTTGDERQLRVMLVLAHEALRRREEKSAPSAAPVASTVRRVRTDDYSELVAHIHSVLAEVVPPGARVLVVSRGDDELLSTVHEAAHFPQGRGGGYAGYYPQDSAAAVAHLETLKTAGAEFLAFPATAFWWLDYYRDFALHLMMQGRVVHHDEQCLIFDLQYQGASSE